MLNSSLPTVSWPENRFPSQSTASTVSCSQRWWGAVFSLCLVLLVSSGCDNASKKLPENNAVPPSTVSKVPLRIRIVGAVGSPELIQRRWLSGSEQPIEIQQESVDQFLSNAACDADVVLFPSRLLGEVVARDWISRLPNLENKQLNADELEAPRAFPPAWIAQCTYGGVTYALPLGCSIPSFVASESFAAALHANSSDRESAVSLQSLLDNLPNSASGGQPQGEPANMDRDALVDRFLALAFALTNRKTQYGVLFDLESMQPRLNEPEFLKAAEAILRLSAQPQGGLLSTTQSHTNAWNWATHNEQPGVVIATTCQLNEEAAKTPTGAFIQIANNQSINSGSGMIAAIAVNCRQSYQSARFLKWLTDVQTSNVLAPLIPGVDSPTPVSIEALSWRVQQDNAQVALNDQLPQELRIPGAHALRMKLADELLAMLVDSKSPELALADAQSGWQAFIDPQRDAAKLQYQQSLGLKEIK